MSIVERKQTEAKLYWHPYRYFPYEKELAIREIKSILQPSKLIPHDEYIHVVGHFNESTVRRLAYFGRVENHCWSTDTTQAQLEQSFSVSNGREAATKRQVTRYSVHGIHEYKGKFNPQVVRGLINILGLKEGQTLLDPFCGSGTALVEGCQNGLHVSGTDLNPFAVFLSNVKLSCLSVPARDLERSFERIFAQYRKRIATFKITESGNSRIEYLKRWFDPEILRQIELLRIVSEERTDVPSRACEVLVSDLLRDYSLQEPADLRIRRRKTPIPHEALFSILQEKGSLLLKRLSAAQKVFDIDASRSRAYCLDVKSLKDSVRGWHVKPPFDSAITSPPYSTALPYIDTQRLSLVWLGLIESGDLMQHESRLTGSRELSAANGDELLRAVKTNPSRLSPGTWKFCRMLQSKIGKSDGFRRKAVPILLYRYLSDMQLMFRNMRKMLRSGAPFAMIVGTNRTTLSGETIIIDTPKFLEDLALSEGFNKCERTSLETYQRYGLHSKNAISEETLLIVRNS